MKRRMISILIAVLLLSTLSACTQPQASESTTASVPTPSETTDMEETQIITSDQTDTSSSITETTSPEVEDPDSRIIVTLPDGWEKVEGSVLQHQYMKGIASFMLKTEPLYQSTELPDVVEEAMGYMESSFEKVTRIGEAETLTIGGEDAMKISFTADVAGMSMQYTYFFFYVGEDLYVGTLGTLADDYTNMEADFNQIISSGISIA